MRGLAKFEADSSEQRKEVGAHFEKFSTQLKGLYIGLQMPSLQLMPLALCLADKTHRPTADFLERV